MIFLQLALICLMCLAFKSTRTTGTAGMFLLFIIQPKFMALLLIWSVIFHLFIRNNIK